MQNNSTIFAIANNVFSKLSMRPDKHILIIEDNLEVIELLKDILEPSGYKVTAMTESMDILQTVIKVAPDLVIVDYILEGINGGEYCNEIKQHPDTGYIPVMIFSGYPKVLSSLGDYGADMIVYKPFDVQDFSERVAQLTNNILGKS